MNDRIRQLSNQAYDELVNQTGNIVVFDEDFQQRFAQLIVQECAKEAFKYTWNEENYQHYNDNGWDCLPGDLKSHIEEHFEVEE